MIVFTSNFEVQQMLKSYNIMLKSYNTLCCHTAVPIASTLALKNTFSSAYWLVHHESAVAAWGKSKVPPYVPADLLRKCNMLPCCPQLG